MLVVHAFFGTYDARKWYPIDVASRQNSAALVCIGFVRAPRLGKKAAGTQKPRAWLRVGEKQYIAVGQLLHDQKWSLADFLKLKPGPETYEILL
jgi:hypothetical protein